MFQKTTSPFTQNIQCVSCTTLWMAVAFMLLACTQGCQTTTSDPSRIKSQQSSPAGQTDKQTLTPGQRIEAIIVQPAAKIKSQRVRGVINAQHRLMLPALGTFNTQNKTIAQLEQEVLASFNQGSNLKGTVRLNLVTLETTGLFVPANQQTTQSVLSDPIQKKLLDQNNHTLWQWVFIGDDIANFPLREGEGKAQGDPDRLHQRFAVLHQGRRAILAQPAHAILTGQSLHDNVIEAHISLNPINQYRNLTTLLSPAAGTALNPYFPDAPCISM